MYPEESAGAPSAGIPDFGGEGMKSRLAYHLEGLVPIILIAIIAIFLAVKFDFINSGTPVLGIIAGLVDNGNQANVLIISDNDTSVSPEILEVFNQNSDLVKYKIRPAGDIAINPKQKLENYDIIMLDGLSEVSLSLGEAIVEKTKGGGKLITILDAGIRRPNTPDVLGWEETFGDVIPVTCENSDRGTPGCLDKLYVRGKLYRENEDHPIMKGAEEIPQEPNYYIDFEILNVNYIGNEIAYIKGAEYQKPFPGIIEKRMVFGKSMYFNYNPGKTPNVLLQTIKYLK